MNQVPRPLIPPPRINRRTTARRQADVDLRELIRQVVMDFDCHWHPHRDTQPCDCSMARLGRFARENGIAP